MLDPLGSFGTRYVGDTFSGGGMLRLEAHAKDLKGIPRIRWRLFWPAENFVTFELFKSAV